MKGKGIMLLVVIVILLGFWNTQTRSSSLSTPKTITPAITSIPSPHITVTFPKGGETLKQGQIYTLTWTPGTGKINIFLINTAFKSQGTSVSLLDRVYSIPNSGAYTYTVPKNLPDGIYQFQIDNMTTNTFYISSSSK